MEYLVYSVEPLEENATLDGFSEDVDPELARLELCFGDIDHERVMENTR